MEESKQYVAIEIAASKIRMMIGFVLNGSIFVLHNLETDTLGVLDGQIVDSDKVGESLKLLKKSAEDTLGYSINDCYFVIPPLTLSCFRNDESTHTISGSVTSIDIENALSLVKQVKLSGDSRIVDVIPYLYLLDNGERYKSSPLTLKTDTLSVYASLYAMSKSVLSGYEDAIFKSSLACSGFVVAPLATAYYLATLDDMPSHYLLLNIGESITTFSYVQNSGEVIYNECYRFGGKTITEAIRDRFTIPFEKAEELKCVYGIDEDPSFPFVLGNGIKLSLLAKVIKDTLSPYITKIARNAETWSKEEGRNLQIVISGGGSKLKGLKELIEKNASLEVTTCSLKSLGARDESLLCLLGTINYAYRKDKDSPKMVKTNKESTKADEVGFDLSREG